jgi:hypothetical protein
MSQKKAKRQRQERRRTSEETRAALAEQLRLLSKRCREFDNGDWGEAADMATRMRVILSPGSKSKPSIIQSLGADKIPLLSTCPPISENVLWASGGLYTQEFAKDENSVDYRLFPHLGNSAYSAKLPARQWWEQVVEVGGQEGEPHVFCRKDVISDIANKDGGAHLASLIPDSYDVMSKPGGLVTITIGAEGDTEDIPIVGVHLAMLRQIAYEILNSPALHRLAERGTW